MAWWQNADTKNLTHKVKVQFLVYDVNLNGIIALFYCCCHVSCFMHRNPLLTRPNTIGGVLPLPIHAIENVLSEFKASQITLRISKSTEVNIYVITNILHMCKFTQKSKSVACTLPFQSKIQITHKFKLGSSATECTEIGLIIASFNTIHSFLLPKTINNK